MVPCWYAKNFVYHHFQFVISDMEAPAGEIRRENQSDKQIQVRHSAVSVRSHGQWIRCSNEKMQEKE